MGVNGNEAVTAGAKTVTVMVIHPNFKTVTVTVILEKLILKNNKTAGNNVDSNGIYGTFSALTCFPLEFSKPPGKQAIKKRPI